MEISVMFGWPSIVAAAIMAYGFWKAMYRLPVGMNPTRISSWYMGVGWTFLGIMRASEGYFFSATLDAAFAAFEFYRWWNSGGGDGVKNFLQSLVMKPAYAVK